MRSYVLGKPYVLGVMLSKSMEAQGLTRAALSRLAVPVAAQTPAPTPAQPGAAP
jgi:hypothetical protein